MEQAVSRWDYSTPTTVIARSEATKQSPFSEITLYNWRLLRQAGASSQPRLFLPGQSHKETKPRRDGGSVIIAAEAALAVAGIGPHWAG